MAWTDKARQAAAAARRSKKNIARDSKAFWSVRKHIKAGTGTRTRLESKSQRASSARINSGLSYAKQYFRARAVTPLFSQRGKSANSMVDRMRDSTPRKRK